MGLLHNIVYLKTGLDIEWLGLAPYAHHSGADSMHEVPRVLVR